MRRCSSSRKSLEPLVQPSSSAGLPQACHPLPETYSSSTVTTSKSRRHPPHQKRCLYCISLVLGFFVSPSLNFRGPVGPSWLNELMQWRMFLHPYQHRRSEEHTSELQSLRHLVCRLLLEKKKEETIQLIYSLPCNQVIQDDVSNSSIRNI